jgi:cellulose 1,4-beta-cellobiosidase
MTRTSLFIGLCALAACSGSASDAQDPLSADGGTDRGSDARTANGDAPRTSSADAAPAADGGTIGSNSGNPFAGAVMYVNPDYVTEVEAAAEADPTHAATLAKVGAFSTAIWLDTISRTATLGKILDDALAKQTSLGKPVVVTFVVYDLPGRDCHANASNGELTLSAGDVQRYHTDYIDVIAAAFAAHSSLRIAAVVEPDSLPNLATNLSDPRCAAAQDIYKAGVAYAVSKLSAPHVALYLDAGHSGWLGWPNNTTAAAQIFKDVLTSAGGADKIRGFATNTANYSVLHETHELFDYQSNPCHDELTFVSQLAGALSAIGVGGKYFVVDTSRNGTGGIRQAWGSWCNVHGAAIGERPVADPVPGVDAYLWVKPPGESDGTSDSSASRFDSACGSGNPDATQGAPQAGQWFASYFSMVAVNAAPPM